MQPTRTGRTLLQERLALADEVRAAMARKHQTRKSLAVSIGISPATLYRRLSGEAPFALEEVVAIARTLDVPFLDLIPQDV